MSQRFESIIISWLVMLFTSESEWIWIINLDKEIRLLRNFKWLSVCNVECLIHNNSLNAIIFYFFLAKIQTVFSLKKSASSFYRNLIKNMKYSRELLWIWQAIFKWRNLIKNMKYSRELLWTWQAIFKWSVT